MLSYICNVCCIVRITLMICIYFFAFYFGMKRPNLNQPPCFKASRNRCIDEPRSCDFYAEFPGLGNELAEHVVCIPAVWRRGWAGLSLAKNLVCSLYCPNERIAFRASLCSQVSLIRECVPCVVKCTLFSVSVYKVCCVSG
jgi:hypothetical protein